MGIGDSIEREGAVRPSSIEKDVFEQAVWANRTVVIPLNMTRRWENNTSGQPVYEGYAPKDSLEGTDGWLLFKNTYDADSYITESKVAYGSWTLRSSATYG